MTRIIHTKWFHNLIRFFRIQHITKWILQTLSPVFSYKSVRFRIKSPESISIAREIFYGDTYTQFLSENPIRTFIDVGCNTGFFTCLLAVYNDTTLLKGILIDADPEVLEESKWHLRTNNLLRCDTICALVGPSGSSTVDFYVSDFNISSSAIPLDDKYPFPIKSSKKIKVPVIQLDHLIHEKFAEERVNVAKIDIEGSEIDLLKQDLTFLSRVDWIIMEWHKWVIPLEDVSKRLKQFDFQLARVLKEDTICGLALYKNQGIP